MDTSSSILSMLGGYLIQSPILLVWLVGFILAAITWRRHPRVSLLTVIALAIFLIETLVNTYLNLWLPLLLSERGIAAMQMGQIYATKGVLTSIVGAVAWGLLIAAIFSGRPAVTASQ